MKKEFSLVDAKETKKITDEKNTIDYLSECLYYEIEREIEEVSYYGEYSVSIAIKPSLLQNVGKNNGKPVKKLAKMIEQLEQLHYNVECGRFIDGPRIKISWE